MDICAISDLHGYLPYIPPCDLLLLGGDYCPTRNREQEKRFITGPFTKFLKEVPAKHIVGIAGNHDFIFQFEPELARSLPWCYLEDEEITVDGIRIYGTPWTPEFYDWAFMRSEDQLGKLFQRIPTGLDILLSHGPAHGRLDEVGLDITTGNRLHVGSKALQGRVLEVKPNVMICGHIHQAHGTLDMDGIRYYNVAYMNGKFEPQYNATGITLQKELT